MRQRIWLQGSDRYADSNSAVKVNHTKEYGAEVVLYGNDYDEACAHAIELAKEKGYTFIHPFDDLDVATGQGTILHGDHQGASAG